MSLRTGHGTGAGQPRVEVLPADELPAPVPGEPEPLKRRQDGTIADSETARRLGALGGRAKGRSIRLVDSLGLKKIAEDAAFAPYRTAADDFVKEHLAALAMQAGGSVGTGPSTMVASAGLQLAGSRYCFDSAAETGDTKLLKLASQLANDSRQNLLAAYELAVREAQARKASPANRPWMVSE